MNLLEGRSSAVYVGTKELKAWPMVRSEYNEYRGWELPEGENGDDAGYLVEYIDGGKANDPRHSGYISWSPADVFERTYFNRNAATNATTDKLWRETDNRRIALNTASERSHTLGLTDPEMVVGAAERFLSFLNAVSVSNVAD